MREFFKKGLTILLSVVLLCCSYSVTGVTEETETTVYITVSMHGEIVRSKDNESVALLPLELSGQEVYTLDDVFVSAHNTYFEGGAEQGYASASGELGLYITKAWGDENGKFGYQINGGTESVSGLSHTVKNADSIELCIYKNSYPDTESYAKFDALEVESYVGESVELTLQAVSGYDDAWNMLFSPCADTCITVNGEMTEIYTDAEGKASLSFDACGTYLVSALKSKEVMDQTVPAITAPICRVTVIAHDPVEVLRNIAKDCIENGVLNDANMLWFVADLAVYEQLYSEIIRTEQEKQEYLDAVIAFAENAKTPGDLAKAILAIRALGYNARNVYNAKNDKIDVVSKLTELIDEKNEDVTGAYTLPYVIIALRQGEGYADSTQMNYLLHAAVSSKASWQNMEYGPDAAAPMLLALAPEHAKNADIAAAIDETRFLIEALQTDEGWLDSWGAAASTGLVIAGYSALGIDADTVKKNGNSLIDGLMKLCTETEDRFLPTDNSFSTEQGFRGLLAWQLLKSESGKVLYDFSDAPLEAAHASWAQKCPVEFVVTPKDATVTVDEETSVLENKFDLSEGIYTYKVTKSGYKSRTGTIEISLSDAKEHIPKTVIISLDKKEVNHSSSGSITYVQTKPKDEIEPENGDEESKIGGTEIDADKQQSENDGKDPKFLDVHNEAWYYEPVTYVWRQGLMEGTGEGFLPDGKMTRAMLTCVIYRMENSPESITDVNFKDVAADAWYAPAVGWAAESGIIKGVDDATFAPETYVTREQTATILYRYAAYKGFEMSATADLTVYEDAKESSAYAESALRWAVGHAILNGETACSLSPKKDTTRAQMAAILMRFCEHIEHCTQ